MLLYSLHLNNKVVNMCKWRGFSYGYELENKNDTIRKKDDN